MTIILIPCISVIGFALSFRRMFCTPSLSCTTKSPVWLIKIIPSFTSCDTGVDCFLPLFILIRLMSFPSLLLKSARIAVVTFWGDVSGVLSSATIFCDGLWWEAIFPLVFSLSVMDVTATAWLLSMLLVILFLLQMTSFFYISNKVVYIYLLYSNLI